LSSITGAACAMTANRSPKLAFAVDHRDASGCVLQSGEVLKFCRGERDRGGMRRDDIEHGMGFTGRDFGIEVPRMR
jgi:hypothetical protein